MSVMITFDPITTGENYVHESTSWELSKTTNFDVEQDVVARHPFDTSNLVSRIFDYDLSEGEVVYGRVKVHFSDGSESGWSIVEIDEVNNGFTFDGVIIQTPIVSVETLPTGKVSLESFTISLSEFKLYSGSEDHESTTWRIKDIDDNVIFSRPRDIDNLLSITIPSGVLQQTKAYTVEAQFITNYDSKSSFGKKVVITEALAGSGSGVPMNTEGQKAYLKTPHNSEQAEYSILPTIPKTLKSGAKAVIDADSQLIVRSLTFEEGSELNIEEGGELIFLKDDRNGN